MKHVLTVLKLYQFPQETVTQLSLLLNSARVINSSLILEVFISLCWQSDYGVQQIVEAFKTAKETGKWISTLDPVIKVCQTSKNVFLVNRVCTFLNIFIEAHSDQAFRAKMKNTLVRLGVPLLFKALQDRLDLLDFDATSDEPNLYNPELVIRSQQQFDTQLRLIAAQIQAFNELTRQFQEQKAVDKNKSFRKMSHIGDLIDEYPPSSLSL